MSISERVAACGMSLFYHNPKGMRCFLSNRRMVVSGKEIQPFRALPCVGTPNALLIEYCTGQRFFRWHGTTPWSMTRRCMVPEPMSQPTEGWERPLPRCRRFPPTCHSGAGVAAEAATWSPSSHGSNRGFPQPQERSNSVRLSIAGRSPVRAMMNGTKGYRDSSSLAHSEHSPCKSGRSQRNNRQNRLHPSVSTKASL